jgi:hypothetical protein
MVRRLPQGGNPESAAYQAAFAEAADPAMTAEKREREDGVLCLFHDFLNYKAQLSSIEDILVGNESNSYLAGPGSRTMGLLDTGNLEVPESCIDWIGLEKNAKDILQT